MSRVRSNSREHLHDVGKSGGSVPIATIFKVADLFGNAA